MLKPALILLGLLPAAAPAQSASHSHTHGAGHAHGAALPTEPGQGAFAALSEIVALLSADPATDWSRVDIAALHAHLMDMDRLMTDSQPVRTPVPGGLGWYQSLALFESVARQRRIIGFDIMEFAPIPNFHAYEFSAALLTYKLLGMVARFS